MSNSVTENYLYRLNGNQLVGVILRSFRLPTFIICLEDGRRLKMLKRHLKTAYSMTPEQYRERWGLPSSYPMVAPNYAKLRTGIAKGIGLGKNKKSQKKVAA